jgi:hypothetical protein
MEGTAMTINTNSNGNNRTRLGKIGKGLLLLLIVFFFSGIAAAQNRYTVNRPIPQLPAITEEMLQEKQSNPVEIGWQTDYEEAVQTAKTSTRQLLIYFYAERDLPQLLETTRETYVQRGNTKIRQLADVAPADRIPLPIAAACRKFEENNLDDNFVRSGLDKYVLLKLPMDAKIVAEDGTETALFSQPEFEHMAGHSGLVVIDFEHRDAPYYGEVTGILPFWRAVCPTAAETATFLDLPPGTLTQRTLTYAVRIHRDKPLSSEGEALPMTVQTATDHALYQAERNSLGHQNFGARSRKVIDALGGGMPSEICAQSWSEESMFEGAIGCMRAWRNSSGHWSIAKKPHRYYGYDMARSKNGAWYAVGFFID